MIASFSGPDGEQRAQATLADIRIAGGLPEAYLERRGKAVVIAYGRYDGPTGAAQRDLDRIHGLRVGNTVPYQAALLSPPAFESLPGSIPEYDLGTVKQRMGKNALYTLQVAVYERSDGQEATPAELAEVRSAAERAAVELRRQGDTAFYYHGPRRSMVTVGVFGPADVDLGKPGARESFAILEAKRRHPLNLVNGQGAKVKVRGQTRSELQKSFIVAIP